MVPVMAGARTVDSMRDAVIVGAVRTPVGDETVVCPAFIRSICRRTCSPRWRTRTGFERGTSRTWCGARVSQVGEQSWNVAATRCSRPAGPSRCPAPRWTGSAGRASRPLHFAAATVLSGQADLVVAGGVESMSRVPMGSCRWARPLRPIGPGTVRRAEFNQGVGAEMVAARWGFSRSQLDEYALASHAAAAKAQDAGDFDTEIAPVTDWPRTRASGATPRWRSWAGSRRRSRRTGW